MKSKKVTQYTCEFCGKKRYTKFSMKEHEKHCTKNPDRECRFCIHRTGESPNLREILTLIPDTSHTSHEIPDIPLDSGFDIFNGNNLKQIVALNKVKDKIENCPACILSIIRIKNIQNIVFDYKKAVDDFWRNNSTKHSFKVLSKKKFNINLRDTYE